MNKSIKTIVTILMFFLFVTSFPIVTFAQPPIDIGLVAPMTGPGAMMGRDQRDGALLMFDKMNDAGGINGRKFNVIIMDDKNSPTVALNAAKKLIYQDKVFAIITTYSPTSLAVMPLTQETETPHLLTGVAKKILEMGSKWIVRITPSDSILAGVYVTYAVKELKLTKLAILNENTDYGKGGMGDVVDKMKEYAMKPLLIESYNLGDKDFAGQLNKIKNAGADGLFVWGLYVEGAQIVRQAKQLGLTMPILASTGVLQGAFLELAGKDAEGIYIQSYFHLKDPAPQVQAYIKEYREKYRYDPQPGSAVSYDTATLLVNAIKKVGLDKFKVMKEMRSTRFRGTVGRIECDDVGQCGRSALILEVKGGEPVVIWSSD